MVNIHIVILYHMSYKNQYMTIWFIRMNLLTNLHKQWSYIYISIDDLYFQSIILFCFYFYNDIIGISRTQCFEKLTLCLKIGL